MRSSTTTTLKYHLQKAYQHTKERQQEKTFEKKKADELVARFISRNCLSLRIVDDPDFVALLPYLRSEYTPPSRKILTNDHFPSL